MNKKPVAIGLLACDQVIVEEKTRNVTPVNCFTHRAARDFPTEAISSSVLAFLGDGLGEIDLEVVLQDLDNMDVLHRVGGRSTSTSHWWSIVACFGFANCPSPKREPTKFSFLPTKTSWQLGRSTFAAGAKHEQ
jgi:hypothetical protein